MPRPRTGCAGLSLVIQWNDLFARPFDYWIYLVAPLFIGVCNAWVFLSLQIRDPLDLLGEMPHGISLP